MTNVAKNISPRQRAHQKGITWLNEVGTTAERELRACGAALPVEREPVMTSIIEAVGVVLVIGFFIWAFASAVAFVGGNDYDVAQRTESYNELVALGVTERQMALDSAAYYGN